MAVSAVPLYAQLADFIAGQIEAGKLQPGQKMPAERDLAEQRKPQVEAYFRVAPQISEPR